MAANVLPRDGFLSSPPGRTQDEAHDQAMLRAYTTERAMDYGCSLEDMLKLRRRVEAGHGWVDVALQLADDNEGRAQWAKERGQDALSGRFEALAAACCRLAQAGLEFDLPRRVQVYQRQALHFRRAASCASQGGGEFFQVLHRGAPHAAWLFRAGTPAPGQPVVVVWGGADGWCEAFHASVPAYTERGLSVCLLELPGQGLARLQHGSMLDLDFTRLVSAALDTLVERGFTGERFGVVGHSAGGALALAAAAADRRIRACCSNGGSPRMLGLEKYPRVRQRLGRMMGDQTPEADVHAFFERMCLEDAARGMRASLLSLHGGLDPLVETAEAEHLVALRGQHAAKLAYWPEGVHCLYNHALERNSVLVDWFARELA